jgi:hypothetical protein
MLAFESFSYAQQWALCTGHLFAMLRWCVVVLVVVMLALAVVVEVLVLLLVLVVVAV